VPNQKVILTDYEAKKIKHKKGEDTASQELEAPMIREFAIHIL
jgi:hypothetical protein